MTLLYGATPPFWSPSARYNAAVDDMVAHRHSWIRIGIPEGSALNEPLCTPTHLEWDNVGLALFETARDYARTRGLRVYFFVELPVGFTGAYTEDQYEHIVDMYLDYLATRFAGTIDAWQLTNEANIGDYRQLGRDVASPAYLSELQRTLSTARTAIRRHDALAPITSAVASSATGGMDSAAYTALLPHLSAIARYLDVIDVHVYDGAAGSSLLTDLPAYLNSIGAFYGKPVWIGEYGQYSATGSFTEAGQSASIVAHLAAFAATVKVAFLYQWQDEQATVTVNTQGAYSVAPTGVTFTGGGGAGMAGTVQTTGASPNIHVTGVTITSSGHNYSSAPAAALTGGTGTAATVTVNLNNQFLGITHPDGTAKAAYASYLLAQPAAPALASVAGGTLEGSGLVPGGWDWDVLEKARWEQSVFAGTNSHGPQIMPAALDTVPWWGRNILLNGGLELNSRGASSYDSSLNDTCPADGWQATWGVWSRETTIVDGGGTSVKVTPDSTHTPYMQQRIFNFQQYKGQTLSLKARVFGCLAYVAWDDGVQGTSDLIDCTAGWTTINRVFTVSPTATQLVIFLAASTLNIPTPVFYIDNISLTRTDGPVRYQPPNRGVEQRRAQERYWQTKVSHRFRAMGAGHIETIAVPFPLAQLGTAGYTVTNVNTGGAVSTNVASATIVDIDTQGLHIDIAATAAGDCIFTNQTLVVDAGVY